MAPRISGASKEREAEELRKQLTQFMQSKGLTVTGWANRAGVTEGTLRSFLGRRSKTLTHATLLALANAVQEPVIALLRGKSIWGNTTRVEVMAVVSAAETTTEFVQASDKAKYSIQVPMPEPGEIYFGAVIDDDSADEKWDKDSILICAAFGWDGKFDLLSEGDIVIIQEKRSQFSVSDNFTKQLFKITARELLDVSGQNYLMMRSKSPRHRNSISIHIPIIGTKIHGPIETGLGSEVTLLGKVLASYTLQPAARSTLAPVT